MITKDIKIRLKEKMAERGIKVPELSRITDIPKDRIYAWYRDNTQPKQEDREKLEKWINEEKNESSFLEERRLNKLTKSKNRVPLYDAEAAASDVMLTEMTPIHAPDGTIDVGDLLHDSQAAIRIYGNSMLPGYPPGCVLGLVKASSSFIEPGEVYVIETRDRRVFKRLFYKEDDPQGEYITCYSDNILKFEGGARDGKLAYPPFDIHKSEIINLFIVTGVIKRNANSVVINR